MFDLIFRLDLIGVLIEGGLHPDFYPSPLKFNNPGGIALRRLGYKWLTPLGFLLSHFPFNDVSFEAVKFLVNKGNIFKFMFLQIFTFLKITLGSSCVKAIQPGFVPPVIALIALANWEGDLENNLSFAALDYLLRECDALQIT